MISKEEELQDSPKFQAQVCSRIFGFQCVSKYLPHVHTNTPDTLFILEYDSKGHSFNEYCFDQKSQIKLHEEAAENSQIRVCSKNQAMSKKLLKSERSHSSLQNICCDYIYIK